MAEGSGFTEQENKPASKWARLRAFSQRLLRKPTNKTSEAPNVASKEQAVMPTAGYTDFVESTKKKSEHTGTALASIMNEEYANLLSLVDSDARLTAQTKKALVDGINSGNLQVIAIVTGRLMEKVRQDSRVAKGAAKKAFSDRFKKVSFLAGRIEREYITDQVERDDSPTLLGIKQHEARLGYFDAIKSPLWKPIESVPLGISKSLEGSLLNPDMPASSQPPQTSSR